MISGFQQVKVDATDSSKHEKIMITCFFFKWHFKNRGKYFSPHIHNAPDHISEHLNFNPTSSCPIHSWGCLDTLRCWIILFATTKSFWKGYSQSYESTDGQQCIDFILAIRGSLVLSLRRMCSIDFVVFLYISFKLNVVISSRFNVCTWILYHL